MVQTCKNRLFEAPLVVVLNVDDGFFPLDGGWRRYVCRSGKRPELCDDDDAVLDTIAHETAATGVEIVNTYDHLANQFVKVKIVAVSNGLRS